MHKPLLPFAPQACWHMLLKALMIAGEVEAIRAEAADQDHLGEPEEGWSPGADPSAASEHLPVHSIDEHPEYEHGRFRQDEAETLVCFKAG